LGFAAWVPKVNNTVDPDTQARIAAAANLVRAAKDAKAVAEQVQDDAESGLKMLLADKSVSFLNLDTVRVAWSQTAGQERIDNKALYADLIARGGDPEKFRKAGKPGEKLTIDHVSSSGLPIKPKTTKEKVSELVDS
jgi:hypothetical protein